MKVRIMRRDGIIQTYSVKRELKKRGYSYDRKARAWRRGKVAEKRKHYEGMKSLKGADREIKKGKAVMHQTYYEKELSENRQYGILMELLKDKVSMEGMRRDIANNIHMLPNTRAGLVTHAELYEKSGEVAGVLTLYGFLPKDTRLIYKKFMGWVSLSKSSQEFVMNNKKAGRLIGGNIKVHIQKSPIMITRIRTRFSFA